MPYGHASMLLLGEGSEATEPYNKYVKIRPHSFRSLQFDQKVRHLSFRPEKFDLFTATHHLPLVIHMNLCPTDKITLGSNHTESEWTPCKIQNESFLVGAFYCKHSDSNSFRETLCNKTSRKNRNPKKN